MIRIGVIGGGPAGMMAAYQAAARGAEVTVFERNPFAGKKLRITGKGRCNVTNDCTRETFFASVLTNPKFLYSAAAKFTPADTMAFFEEAGVPLKVERGNRVFPVSDQAVDIAHALEKRCKNAGVVFRFGCRVTEIAKAGSGYAVCIANGNTIRTEYCDRVIVATGGVSYPATGSDGDGHRMLAGLGVSVTPLSPSLVPVETKEDVSGMMGLSLRNVTLTVTRGGKTIFHEMGEMLFTHFGVSGPLVLSASANMQKGNVSDYRFSIDLKPALERETLDKRVLSDFAKCAHKDLINALDALLPKSIIPYFLDASGVSGRKKAGELTREERLRLVDLCKSLPLTPTKFRPMAEAIVTHGGVSVKAVNPGTMELRELPGIYVCGELLDTDAYTGGFNLQIAFSTACTAGKSAAETDDAIDNAKE